MGRPKKETEIETALDGQVENAQAVNEAEKQAWIAKEKAHIKSFIQDGEAAQKMAEEHWLNRKAYDVLRAR